jgi:hypothetical protein
MASVFPGKIVLVLIVGTMLVHFRKCRIGRFSEMPYKTRPYRHFDCRFQTDNLVMTLNSENSHVGFIDQFGNFSQSSDADWRFAAARRADGIVSGNYR